MRRVALLSTLFCLFPQWVQGGEASLLSTFDESSSDLVAMGDSLALDLPGNGLEFLVPELEGRTFHFSGDSYLHRLGFSPGVGQLGNEPLSTFRLSYSSTSWLEHEASIGHNRGKTVHALVHMLNTRVRYPLDFRVRPYVTAGFGVILVFPGPSINASPVTKNVLAAGGGLEVFLRDDVAIRGEWRRLGVFGRDAVAEESAVYGYGEATVGFSFYRRVE